MLVSRAGAMWGLHGIKGGRAGEGAGTVRCAPMRQAWSQHHSAHASRACAKRCHGIEKQGLRQGGYGRPHQSKKSSIAKAYTKAKPPSTTSPSCG